MRSISALMSMVVFLSLGACTTTSRTAMVPDGQEFRCEVDQMRLFERLAIADQQRDASASVDLLLLSGGGARGAWGAGFLQGWHEGGGGPSQIPEFDIVTGVSTGALQATHAFLGDYQTLYKLYTTTTNEQVWKKRFLLAALFSNSLLKSDPLAETLEELVDGPLLERVAAEADKRLLCVGTVGLNSGLFREWDLTAIASAYVAAVDEARRGALLNLYRTVLLGSASIPVAFPPVEIKENGRSALYVDGGTRENVFVAFGEILDSLLQPLPATRGLDAYGGQRIADLLPVRVFVIVNGQLGIRPAPVENRLFPIGARSLEALMAQSSNGALYQIEYELSNRDDLPRNRIETRYTYIPGEFCLAKSALDFDPPAMQELACAARQYGSDFTWFDFKPDLRLPPCQRSLPACE